MGDAEAEGAARKGRSASGGEEEEEALGCKLHIMLLSGKLRRDVSWANDREGGG